VNAVSSVVLPLADGDLLVASGDPSPLDFQARLATLRRTVGPVLACGVVALPGESWRRQDHGSSPDLGR
jgi:hypothetical protein